VANPAGNAATLGTGLRAAMPTANTIGNSADDGEHAAMSLAKRANHTFAFVAADAESPRAARGVRINLLHAGQREWHGEHQSTRQVDSQDDKKCGGNHA